MLFLMLNHWLNLTTRDRAKAGAQAQIRIVAMNKKFEVCWG